MKPEVKRLYDRFYPLRQDGSRRGDGSAAFYGWIRSTPGLASATALNLGAGPTPEPALRRLRGEVGHLVGVDVDPIVLSNQDLDEAHVSDGRSLPFPDRHFELVYSDWTMEHVADPAPLLREVFRVLAPGGRFYFRTTNRAHYVTAIAAGTPHWFHRLMANRVRDLSSEDHEPWPTFYQINSGARVRRLLATAGFERVEVALIEPYPVYLVFHPWFFRLGVLYERLVSSRPWLARFRLILIARGEVPQSLTR